MICYWRKYCIQYDRKCTYTLHCKKPFPASNVFTWKKKKELRKYLLDEVLGVGKGSPWIKVLNVKADNPVLKIWKKEPPPSSWISCKCMDMRTHTLNFFLSRKRFQKNYIINAKVLKWAHIYNCEQQQNPV